MMTIKIAELDANNIVTQIVEVQDIADYVESGRWLDVTKRKPQPKVGWLINNETLEFEPAKGSADDLGASIPIVEFMLEVLTEEERLAYIRYEQRKQWPDTLTFPVSVQISAETTLTFTEEEAHDKMIQIVSLVNKSGLTLRPKHVITQSLLFVAQIFHIISPTRVADIVATWPE